MAIKFYLTDNKLTPNPKDRRAVVLSDGTYSMDDVIDRISEKIPLASEPVVRAVAQCLFECIAGMMEEGWNVNTPLCHFRSGIQGVFANDSTSFNPNLHKVVPKISPTASLRNRLAQVKVEKVEAVVKSPNIMELAPCMVNASNKDILRNELVTLQGHHLAFDPEDSEQGIFFIDSERNETKVNRILLVKPREVFFVVPDTLIPGVYSIALKTKKLSTTMRSGGLIGIEVK